MPTYDRYHAQPLGPNGECGECGQPHYRAGRVTCAGHVVNDRDSYVPGQPRKPLDKPRACVNWAMLGQSVCYVHGGRAAQNKAAAAERLEREAAQQLALTLGEPVEGADPGDVISERIAARTGHVRWLLARVRALEPDALTWGLTRRKTAVDRGQSDDETPGRRFAGTDEGDTHEAKPHIWYTLYIESARELERLCIEAIRVGLEERRVRMDEQMADMWVRSIDGIIRALGHDPNDPETAEIVARHLELVA